MADPIPDPPDLGPEQLSTADFSRAKRGYDPVEVTTLLGRAADALRTWQERDTRLWERVTSLSAELDDAREIDEDRITAALGEETARIIAVAREAAASIRDEATRSAAQVVDEADAAADESRRAAAEELESARSESERLRTEATLAAADLRREADEFAESTRSAAESRRAELLDEAERVLGERTADAEAAASAIRETAEVERDAALAEAERVRAEAREVAAAEVERAVEEGRAMVAEAQEYREQVLRSLAARHQEAQRRIEAAREERDRIVAAIRQVGSALGDTVDDLASDEGEFAPQPHVSVEDFVSRATAELRPVPVLGGAGSPSGTAAAGTTGADESVVDDTAADDTAADDTAAGDPVAGDPVAGDTAADGEPEVLPEVGVDSGTDSEAESAAESAADSDAESAAESEAGSEVEIESDMTREEAVLDRRILEQGDSVAEVVELPTVSDDAEDSEDDATVHDLFERVRAATTDDTGSDDAAADETASDETASDPAEVPSGPLDRRDALLEPIGESLARSLKRAVSDEQNEVLDQLRRARRTVPGLDDLLGATDDVERYLEHLTPDLRSAARAGVTFWSAESGSDGGGDLTETLEAALLPEGRLHSLVQDLLGRRRAHLARVLDEAADEGLDLAGVQGKVRGAYREWRSAQTEGAAGDLAAAGFALGVGSAAAPGSSWCWLVDHGGLPCSDAEDNALAGPVTVGDPFPTGDALPPAHAGCRCILIPAPR